MNPTIGERLYNLEKLHVMAPDGLEYWLTPYLYAGYYHVRVSRIGIITEPEWVDPEYLIREKRHFDEIFKYHVVV
jgi:hypothetical protein